jgi:hypothetical protein
MSESVKERGHDQGVASDKIKPVSWVKAAVYAGVIVLVYYSALTQMGLHDWNREDYSHCWLIPCVIIYLLWEKKARACIHPFQAGNGQGFGAPGYRDIFFWCRRTGRRVLHPLPFPVFVIIGLAWLHLGWQKTKAIWFAMVMMLNHVPLPNIRYHKNYAVSETDLLKTWRVDAPSLRHVCIS